MKTLKLIACIILTGACSSFAQTKNDPATPTQAPVQTPAQTQPGQPPMGMGQQPGPKMNRYMVMIPHTKENCQKVMTEMKEKGGPMAMRFEWGCVSGDHTGYAMMQQASEDAVRKMLPESLQKTAKITKLDRMNTVQLEQQHK